jgi:GT2 family glycosyltransferase
MDISRVLISILNWNKAAVTLDCLASLRRMDTVGFKADILVIDNGSAPADHAALAAGIDPQQARMLHLEKNLGFTGGHNVALKMAVEDDYDFIWLLNNDATVQPDTLDKLVRAMAADPRCGAASPVIYAEGEVGHLNAWGATHDWGARNTGWLPSAAAAMKLQETAPERLFLAGTAVLFRMEAMRQVGLLDERLFAYFDDNDIGTRLVHAGWHSKVVFDAATTHGARDLSEQPPYFFYLMFRNELIFWHTHMPQEHRKLLWLKLVNTSMFNVNRLRRRGMARQAEAALLGVSDFIVGKYGAPELARTSPLLVRLACRVLGRVHDKQLRAAVQPNAAAAS